MIRIEGLEFRHPRSDFALRIDELRIARGEIVAMIGPSGCGKTTLLHIVAGIRQAQQGCVQVGETEPARLSDSARQAFRIRRIGLVFQDFALVEYLNVLDNILLPCRISGALPLDDAMRQRAGSLADDLGIGDKLKRNVGSLSQGEKQRVAVCRALLPNPSLVLADEPTGNLDPSNKIRVLEKLIDSSRKAGATLLAVTHDRDLLGHFERVIDFKEFHAP